LRPEQQEIRKSCDVQFG